MKKVILSLAILAFGYTNAQEVKTVTASEYGFSKGNIFVEGQLSFGSSKETESFEGQDVSELKTGTFTFTPKAGFFVTDDLAVGAQLAIGSGKREETTFGSPNVIEERTVSAFGAGVFARYYFLNLGERFKTYAEVGAGFGTSKDEVDSEEVAKTNTFGIGLDLGINYFVTKKIAISFGLADVLAFNSSKTETPGGGESKESSFGGNVNVFNNFFDTPTFGLLYKF